MPHTNGSPLLSNRCYLPHRSLWFGWAHLYTDRVCIQGWTWRGRYRRVVPVKRIDRVKWWAVLDDVNLLLGLGDGQAVPLQLRKNAGTWNAKLHDLLDQSLMVQHSLPTDGLNEPVEAARER